MPSIPCLSLARRHNAIRHPRLFPPSPGRAARHRRAPSSVRMALREDGPSVAIVGATGAVGQEFLRVITDRDFPYRSLRLLASKRSAGKRLASEDREYTVQDLASPGAFDGVDIALFNAGGSVSRKYGPAAVASGAVVDNSSAFRMDPEVPLVIPEAMGNVRLGQGAIVANPNCSTIIGLMAATPLHRHAKVLRMVVSTYQAASGAGAAAMEELKLQTQEVLEGKGPTSNIFKQQYAFNIFSHNAPVLENGYNEEEMKMVKETRKIWNDKDVKVTATCIRVPVMRAHAESVNLQFEKPLDEDTAREILRGAPGVTIIDDRASNRFPTPLEVSDKDDVAVARIRRDLSLDDNRGVGGGTAVTVKKIHACCISVSGDASSLPTYGAQFCLDSGATHHMVGDLRILSNIRDAPAGLTVTLADGSTLHITKVGDIEIPSFTIPGVWLVPGLKSALISVRQLTSSGVCMWFIRGHAMLYLGSKLVGVADAEENTDLYILQHLRMPINVAVS